MAKKTTIVSLTTAAWTALSVAGQTNVRVQRRTMGSFRIGVAEAPADLTTTDGHVIQSEDTDMTVFTGLGPTHVIYGRSLSGTTPVVVTAY